MSAKASYFNERLACHSERRPRPIGATTLFAKESGVGRTAGLAATEPPTGSLNGSMTT